MLELVLKGISPQMLLVFLPLLLTKLSNFLRDKDANSTGADDVAAKLILDFIPAIDALTDKTAGENAFKKSLKAIRTTIDNYLGDR